MRQPFVQRAGVFQNKWVVPRDESVESLEDDLRYEGSHYSLKSVRVKCDSDKITRFYVTFVERWNSTSSEKDGKNVFVFKDGERLKIMALYFSFATKFDQLASTEKTSAEVTHAAFKRARIKHFPRSWTEFEAERIALPSIRAFRGAAIPRKLSDELSSSFSERKDLRVSLTPERQPSTSSETRTPDIVSDIPNPDCSSLSMVNRFLPFMKSSCIIRIPGNLKLPKNGQLTMPVCVESSSKLHWAGRLNSWLRSNPS